MCHKNPTKIIIRGVMEMLAEKNAGIKKAYNVLKIVSQDEKARMLYDSRQAELMDQSSRLKDALQKGRDEGKLEVAKNLISIGLDIPTIVNATGLSAEEVTELMNQKH
jgi:predicted transposase/invertase (TIGR01784 family)